MATTTIPVRIELEYMMDQRRLLRDLEFLTVASLNKRADSEELLAWLRLSVPQVLDEARLRRKLQAIATSITAEKIRELSLLLGRPVQLPTANTIYRWVDDQVTAIQFTIEHWLAASEAAVLASHTAGMALASLPVQIRELRKQISEGAERRASIAVLQLNSALIEEISRGAGSTHYRWLTERDSKVRPNHQALEGTIQSWRNEPLGGGTKPHEKGHPGSGYGCRCTAVPLQGALPLSAQTVSLRP